MIFGLYGAGGFGREVLPMAQRMASKAVFIDDTASVMQIAGTQVFQFDEFMSETERARERGIAVAFNVTVADAKVRRKLVQRCRSHALTPCGISHPTAEIGPRIELGLAPILCHGVVVTCDAKIGDYFHANLGSYVAHDCVVGDYVTLAPRVCINGHVRIGNDVYIGTGAMLRPGITVGDGATIGMGAVVTKDVPAGATFVGNPAHELLR